ncbi:MAG: hypothetical protein B7X41_10915 [Microbacterium sp. 14-71-5]|jgi:hypothetical protein|nr:MAG: hypothetical protein B7X41_10915 [Microbacterium sp. 14-71-5]
MGGVPVSYSYAATSALETEGGQLALGLVSTDPESLLDGFVERADLVASGLLRVGEVAATRFYQHPAATAAQIRAADPIITVGAGAVRFESLSADCGVAARLDVLDDGLDVSVRTPGTTNVDLGPTLRRLLLGVRRRDPMRVVVGPSGLRVQTLDGEAHERQVVLPDRWVRSLAELQALASRMTAAVDVDAAQARTFLATLPAKGGRMPFWVQSLSSGLRLSSTPGSGRIAVGSPERLRVLEPLLRQATRLRVYGTETDGPAASWWEVALPGARFGLALSPDLSRGFSGEGALLDELDDLSSDAALARRGLLGYDLADARYFPRHLPFGRDALETAPRLEKARSLVAQGRVRVEGKRLVVTGSAGEHVVHLGGAEDSCTCAWYLKHRGNRGPCAHVVAARLFSGEPR